MVVKETTFATSPSHRGLVVTQAGLVDLGEERQMQMVMTIKEMARELRNNKSRDLLQIKALWICGPGV